MADPESVQTSQMDVDFGLAQHAMLEVTVQHMGATLKAVQAFKAELTAKKNDLRSKLTKAAENEDLLDVAQQAVKFVENIWMSSNMTPDQLPMRRLNKYVRHARKLVTTETCDSQVAEIFLEGPKKRQENPSLEKLVKRCIPMPVQ